MIIRGIDLSGIVDGAEPEPKHWIVKNVEGATSGCRTLVMNEVKRRAKEAGMAFVLVQLTSNWTDDEVIPLNDVTDLSSASQPSA